MEEDGGLERGEGNGDRQKSSSWWLNGLVMSRVALLYLCFQVLACVSSFPLPLSLFRSMHAAVSFCFANHSGMGPFSRVPSPLTRSVDGLARNSSICCFPSCLGQELVHTVVASCALLPAVPSRVRIAVRIRTTKEGSSSLSLEADRCNSCAAVEECISPRWTVVRRTSSCRALPVHRVRGYVRVLRSLSESRRFRHRLR